MARPDINEIPNLMARLFELLVVYDSRIVIQDRPSIVVFNKRRNYSKKSPKEYYIDDIFAYHGLSRAQFALFDNGLYCALLRRGQLDILPQSKYFGAGIKLTKEQEQEIIAAYKKHKTMKKTAEELGRSITTVWKVCHRNNLPINPVGYYRPT